MKRLPIDRHLISALVERFPAISPLIPPPSDAGDHYGCRFNNVHVRLLRRDLKTYRIKLDQIRRNNVKWEPYRDAGSPGLGMWLMV
ncbi:hypothetical protein K1719_012253 [Acacia pycnantha]|nr:hypothetical protein K1719_012253 [Acacia pycnantha]